MSRLINERLGALTALVGLCLLFGALAPRFFEVDNFLLVARQISLNAIVAVGMTLLIVSGGIDLSVGSVLALSTCTSGMLMERGMPAVPALGVGMLVGATCGLLNGLVITRLQLSPFIATLGMMSAARGAAMVLTRGNPISKLDGSYFFLGIGSFLGVPVPVWFMVAVALTGAFVLSRTRFGRYALALGSNEEAVRLSGIAVHRQKILLYLGMGVLSALAGWLLSARVAFADPAAGALMELEAIAAAVIGGASLKGGRGSVIGTLIGAAIMGVLHNGLVFLGVNAFWKDVLVGAVIVAAVSLDQLRLRSQTTQSGQRNIARTLRYGVVGALALGLLALAVFRPTTEKAGSARKVIAMVGKASGGEYWLAVKQGAERRAAELGVDFIWEGPASETDVAKQIDIVENLIQKGVSAIALAPTDANGLTPQIRKALDRGIPVVTVDSDTVGKDRYSYIGTDNRAAGEAAGREIAKLLGGKGKVAVITGVLGAQNLRQRCEGFKAALANSGVIVLEEQTDAGDRVKGVAVAENVLTAHPDVAAFFADTSIGGPAVAQALIARGLAGKVKLVSFDTTPALLDFLKQGAAQALIAQKPERMGELAVEMLVRKSEGEEIEPLVDTGVTIVRTADVFASP